MQATPDDSMSEDGLGAWIGWGGMQIMQDFSLLEFEI